MKEIRQTIHIKHKLNLKTIFTLRKKGTLYKDHFITSSKDLW